MNQSERRDSGLLFLADESAWEEMKRARRLLQRLNSFDTTDFDGVRAIIGELFGKSDETTFVNPPFYCDYGSHIEVGRNCFINYNCTILDNARVVMGDNCMLAPGVSIYTAGHTLHPSLRAKGYEYGKEVIIGDNVWIGGNAIILPGVKVGSNSVIGAGSVVSKDIPEWSLAVGNPCKVIRKITEEDKPFFFADERIDSELIEFLKNDKNIDW